MGIQEAKELKEEMISTIESEIRRFEKETDLEVIDIVVRRVNATKMGGREKTAFSYVEITVEL